ncbi:MAG TPA: VOC family protein [Solirubrobacteraceae bacterium]|nr:VOC family protein [Solirubrobacteraceae bacterium]HUB74932.1 VOC family protein [Solirubrobacteraceae bacterium]
MLEKALAHPTVFVRDLQRAREFYERLGLTVSAQASTGIFMSAGAGTIFPLLHRADFTPPSHTIAAFQVEDLRATIEGLRARGVLFEEYDTAGLRTEDGIADMGAYRAAWLKDPDGNYIGLHEPPRA